MTKWIIKEGVWINPLGFKKNFRKRFIVCPICSILFTDSADHFIPKWMGGTVFHLWDMCGPCNYRKGGRLPNNRECSLFSIARGTCDL